MSNVVSIQGNAADRDVSVMDVYLLISQMYQEMTAMRRQMTDLNANQNRLVDSNLNTLYRPKEVAKKINVHHYTVLDWLKQGRLVAIEGTKVSGWELERFLRENPKYHKRNTAV